jgi:N-acetylglutamate synthase-like GNAT family acetyltransferase
VTDGDEAFVLRKTTDHDAMRSLALKSGLEDGVYHDLVVAYGYFLGNELVGCAGLRIKDGVFTVECLAVAESFRRKGMGRVLVKSIEQEAKARGAKDIWALARAPEFFQRLGWSESDPRDGLEPSLKGCESCRQYKHSCNPAIVYKTV